jgi:hypothetical protein
LLVEFLDLGRGHRGERALRAADELDFMREWHDAEVHPGRRIVGHGHRHLRSTEIHC